ncbi:MAG: hypothetical protein LLG97_08805 [Deltaproteobacteria bacterium]|nr:hypothetical protein [Deltaproteobacteria bacterium]
MAAQYGYPIRHPDWREQTQQQVDDAINRILPTLTVYNSWSYRARCWKNEKRN